MKANELMIGDWICSSINDINVRIAPADLNWDNAHTEWLANSKPIPLTAEILEKNGFTHRNADKILTKQSWTCECGGCIIHAKYNFGFLYFNIYGKPLKPNMFAPHATMHIRYAHELQHILKDCRIDKEIVL